MGFNKGAADVLSKGMDPRHPHKNMGPDGKFIVPTENKVTIDGKTDIKSSQFELDEETKLVKSKLEELLKLVEPSSILVCDVPILELQPKKRGRPPKKQNI